MEITFTGIDRALNAAIHSMASRLMPAGWDETPNLTDAPSSLEELTAHIAKTGRMLVYSGHSDKTVFGCEDTNIAFRAWHDWTHWRYQFPFTSQGEADTCAQQIRDLRRVYGDTQQTDRWAAVLTAEIIGQGEFMLRHGSHPNDQIGFVRAYLANPLSAVSSAEFLEAS